jgi:gluconolactonase
VSKSGRQSASNLVAAGGVHCIAPYGAKLGRTKVPFMASNLAFGDWHQSQLFIRASHTLFAIHPPHQRGAERL